MGFVALFLVGAIFGFILGTLIGKSKKTSEGTGGGGNSPSDDNEDMHERV
jgi:hypothetical protein